MRNLGGEGEMNEDERVIINGEFICVVCPNGCAIDAAFTSGARHELISSEGWGCPKGEEWVRREIESPMRTISTSVLVRGGDEILASVRTKNAIPLAKVMEVMDCLRALTLDAPLRIGQTIAVNPEDSGSDVIVTRSVNRTKNRA
jgi:CxxC motif-containing protein